jgi:hypothetical protein
VNRHERRRTAALARGRRGYLRRVLAAVGNGKLTPGLHLAAVEHDRTCAIYRGAGCDCVPDISVSSPDGVTVIDARGVGIKRARS